MANGQFHMRGSVALHTLPERDHSNYLLYRIYGVQHPYQHLGACQKAVEALLMRPGGSTAYGNAYAYELLSEQIDNLTCRFEVADLIGLCASWSTDGNQFARSLDRSAGL